MKNVKIIIISSISAITICTSLLFLFEKINNINKFTNNHDHIADTYDLHGKEKDEHITNLETSMEKTALKLFYEGNSLDIASPIFILRNSYCLPLVETINKLNGSSLIKDEFITIKFNNKTIELNTKNNTYKKDNNTYYLFKSIISQHSITYISLFDFTNMFDLKPVFEYDKNIVIFYNNKEIFPASVKARSKKEALIRLEDISAGKTYRYDDADSKYKLRIVADYLYSEGIPFHVAWVPRYIDKNSGSNIDNDLTMINSMNNADFLYTLDYFINKGGIIGLHGYTHQAGNDRSIDSKEFANPKDKNSYTNDFALNRINRAKEDARLLDIPIGFFEAPHYSAAPNQLKIMENNFDYLYEPYVGSGPRESMNLVIKKNGKRTVKYIPTPLNYLDGKSDLPNMFKKINNLKPGIIASFFFHPSIEFEDIKIIREANGYPAYTYSKQSALHQIINLIESKGYSFESINNF
ncbi:DUF2334 domain-containing protein [Candidatus Clostridium radicumherbarum]|uniref:DUF2334 domain-containing protein n=1 Tax=Candidatus Clostridium radicumherbarum TaxID=3381662 RepID=A0ABW8TU58_9CLOT